MSKMIQIINADKKQAPDIARMIMIAMMDDR